MKVTKLLMTWAFSVAAACCATAFSSLGNTCRISTPGKCGSFHFGTIALTVISFVICFVALVAWLLYTELAAKVTPIPSFVLLVLLLISVGLVTRTGDMVALGTIFVALVLSLLLSIYALNQATEGASAPKAGETEATAA